MPGRGQAGVTEGERAWHGEQPACATGSVVTRISVQRSVDEEPALARSGSGTPCGRTASRFPWESLQAPRIPACVRGSLWCSPGALHPKDAL